MPRRRRGDMRDIGEMIMRYVNFVTTCNVFISRVTGESDGGREGILAYNIVLI